MASVSLSGTPAEKTVSSLLGLTDLALSGQTGPFLHLQGDGRYGPGNHRGGSETAGREISAAIDLAFHDCGLRLHISGYIGILADHDTSVRIDVSVDRPIENQIGRAMEISVNFDVT